MRGVDRTGFYYLSLMGRNHWSMDKIFEFWYSVPHSSPSKQTSTLFPEDHFTNFLLLTQSLWSIGMTMNILWFLWLKKEETCKGRSVLSWVSLAASLLQQTAATDRAGKEPGSGSQEGLRRNLDQGHIQGSRVRFRSNFGWSQKN